jgi:hypothetical protein
MFKKIILGAILLTGFSSAIAGHIQFVNGGGWTNLTVVMDHQTGTCTPSASGMDCKKEHLSLTIPVTNFDKFNEGFKDFDVVNIVIRVDGRTSKNCSLPNDDIKTISDNMMITVDGGSDDLCEVSAV